LFWGKGGIARLPGGADLTAAYAGAIDELLAGDSRFDVRFARDVVRVLADADELLVGRDRRSQPVLDRKRSSRP
jgi:hypothetical protein